MAYVPAMDDPTTRGYAQILTHLKHAQTAADRLGDQATLALLETLKSLVLRRVAAADAPARPASAAAPRPAALGMLNVHLFGAFRAYLNGKPINGWRKKSETVFKYLVVHRAAPIHRDQLIDCFWSNADPASARNCLNVTLHALRRSLALGDDASAGEGIIQFADDSYHLHPDLAVWTDVDTFAEQINQAQATLKGGDRDRAVAHYEVAAALYQGDFLAGDRYEEWALIHRERLLSIYMMLLTHLSQLHFDAANYAVALEWSRKILERDNCNEDAHCLIMRCCAALGQRGQALRQYLITRAVLARELGVLPMESTTRLYEQIKNG